MAFSATKFIKEVSSYSYGPCKNCKFYKTLKLNTEVQVCILSDKFLISEYEPNYTCKKFIKKEK